MKRIICALLALTLFFSAGCSARGKNGGRKQISAAELAVKRSIEFTEEMDELCEDDELLEFYGVPSEVLDRIQELGRED